MIPKTCSRTEIHDRGQNDSIHYLEGVAILSSSNTTRRCLSWKPQKEGVVQSDLFFCSATVRDEFNEHENCREDDREKKENLP
jgi:hypothetical protein